MIQTVMTLTYLRDDTLCSWGKELVTRTLMHLGVAFVNGKSHCMWPRCPYLKCTFFPKWQKPSAVRMVELSRLSYIGLRLSTLHFGTITRLGTLFVHRLRCRCTSWWKCILPKLLAEYVSLLPLFWWLTSCQFRNLTLMLLSAWFFFPHSSPTDHKPLACI